MLYEEKFSRNLQTLSAGQQEKLRRSVLCIAGLGGTGGFALECLSRLGAERLVVFDHDRFELTNFNRQLLATDASLDTRKADAAILRARSINKGIKIRKHGRFGPRSGASLSGCAAVLDCTDNFATKLLIAESCRKEKIPYIFCSAQGTRGMVSVFTNYPFRKAFQAGAGKKALKSCASVVCPAAALAGSLAAVQALNLVIGNSVVRAPDALFFDIFDRRLSWKARLG